MFSGQCLNGDNFNLTVNLNSFKQGTVDNNILKGNSVCQFPTSERGMVTVSLAADLEGKSTLGTITYPYSGSLHAILSVPAGTYACPCSLRVLQGFR